METRKIDVSPVFDRVEPDDRYNLGEVIDRRTLKIGDMIANGYYYVTDDESVYAPQTIEIGPVGQLHHPQLQLARRLTIRPIYGSHHGYLFPDTGVFYNVETGHGGFSIVNGATMPEQVTLLERKNVAS